MGSPCDAFSTKALVAGLITTDSPVGEQNISGEVEWRLTHATAGLLGYWLGMWDTQGKVSTWPDLECVGVGKNPLISIRQNKDLNLDLPHPQ